MSITLCRHEKSLKMSDLFVKSWKVLEFVSECHFYCYSVVREEYTDSDKNYFGMETRLNGPTVTV